MVEADSEYLKWPDSYGTGYKPCPECPHGKKWAKKLEERKKRCEAFVAERNAIVEKIFPERKPHKKIYHARSEHFTITYNCAKRAGKGMKCDEHTVGWMLLAWMEDTYDLFEDFCGVEYDDKGVPKPKLEYWDDQPRTFYLWASVDSQKKAAQALGSVNNTTSFVYKPFFCTLVEHQFSEHTDHYVVHHAFQLLLDGLEPWRDRSIPEWLINAAGNWAEWELFSECNIAAIGEGMTPWDISIPFLGWPSIIYKRVRSKDVIPFAELARMNIKELKGKHRVQAFAILDYLYTVHGGKKMYKFLVRLKETKDQFKAISDVYELNSMELDEAWQEWVLDYYKRYRHRKR